MTTPHAIVIASACGIVAAAFLSKTTTGMGLILSFVFAGVVIALTFVH